MSATGELEVFSALQKCRDGNEFDVNPAWYQHTDYTVYNLKRERIKHVFNTVGHYAEAPCLITLPSGEYLVQAQAQGYLRVTVPVVIEPGQTTRVHLDATWKPSTQSPKMQLVSTPSGYPVGWRPDPIKEIGVN